MLDKKVYELLNQACEQFVFSIPTDIFNTKDKETQEIIIANEFVRYFHRLTYDDILKFINTNIEHEKMFSHTLFAAKMYIFSQKEIIELIDMIRGKK